ncbi:hypothetical protein ACVRY7_05535 [Streptococcus ictaluri]|uniref:Uncharacterized protein n=1 Tax=Streptococcus ictaluri 707-05 TaxID=764299 RepID=G5K209_9STRE|nr:hypothetical protein [Streptococcus ictaluri]EHI69959.1 hypothetical protein STRIC_2417 [Streptococcus ictaluri 707-05]QBX16566.1 hypothetical protein Javan261_0006 [Streptococcus phage Javan261]
MNTKENAKELLQVEMNWVNKFSQKVKEHVDAKENRLATSYVERLCMARECLSQAHTELWEVSEGKLTDEEFELLSDAEIALHESMKVLAYFKENVSCNRK